METNSDKKLALCVTNTTESFYTMKNNMEIGELAVLNLAQCELLISINVATPSLFPKKDPDIIKYLNELLETDKS